MTRTRWSNSERVAVRAALRQAFARDPRMSAGDAIRQAQGVLQDARRIKVSTHWLYTNRGWIEDEREIARTTATKAVEPPAATVPPAPTPEPKADPTAGLARVLEALLDAIADRVAMRLLDALAGEAPAAAVHRPRHDPHPTTAAARGLPGVLVIGLLGEQAHFVREKYQDRLDLTVLGTDDAGSREPVRRAHTVLMTKFVNHSVQDKYRKAPELRWCNGGVTQLCEILDKISYG